MSEPRTKTSERGAAPPTLKTRAAAGEAGRGGGWRIAIDRGGTFTDIVAESPEGGVRVLKVPTDAADATSDAAIEAIRKLVGAEAGVPIPAHLVREVRCGTTAATNALLERRGERCALLITKGFADLLTIGTQERPDLFALNVLRTLPLPDVVYEIDERVLADGTVRTPVDEQSVRAAAKAVRALGVRSVAIVFLHAYRFPDHEQRAAWRVLRTLTARSGEDVDVFTSSASARELGVVARGETTAADAYLTPVLRRALDRFRSAFAADVDVKFIRSDGGLSDAATARGPAAVLSGPAGGALAVARIAASLKIDAAIGFDMGGTSTDVCRAAPDPEFRYETRAAGFRLRVPSLRVHTVAAGGGSILGCDGRRLTVGPESAGAHPGPAGYGRGGPATLTDADAVLGRLVPEFFPSCFGANGKQPFDVEASRRAIEPLAKAAGLSVEEAAAGFVRVADERVAQAIREESVLRGYDVRTHALVAFGGAGPQHACAVARALGVTKVVVPRLASVLSAEGIAGARGAWERSAAILGVLDHGSAMQIRERVLELEQQIVADAGVSVARGFRVRRTVELRVLGTETPLAVPVGEGRLGQLRAAFEKEHRLAYGFPQPAGAAIEVVNVRVRVEEPARDAPAAALDPDFLSRRFLRTHAWFHGPDGAVAPVSTPVLGRGAFDAAAGTLGPAIVIDGTSTLIVEPGWEVTSHAAGAEVLEPVGTTPPPRATTARDPVSLTLFANAFMSIAERMGAVLERTSHSTNIKERLDFSCAVFDGDGRLIANAPHIPVHLGAMGESVRAVMEARGADLRDGDAIVTNDPYRGGSHLPDVTVVTPVLVENGRAAFFVANRAHHADVGGIAPGSMPPHSTTLAEEGVVLHDLLLVRDGQLREQEIRDALSAGPYPARSIDERLFDFRAQAAANHEGAKLLRELCELHGQDVVAAYMGHVLDDGAAAFEEVLAALPPGVLAADDVLDDGTSLRVSINVAEKRAVVDFNGTGPQSAGNLNAPLAVVRAAVLYAFRTLVRRPIPLNEGCLRPLEIRVPPGSILDPRPPAAVVGGNVETSQRIVDLVLRAVGALAGSQGTMNNVTFGTDAWTYYETLGGGMGAGPIFDGASAVQCHMTNTRITDVEVLERLRPVVVRRFAIRCGSGGEGAHRGGDGLVREIEFLEAARGGVLSERRERGAPGLCGGGDGAAGRNVHIRDGQETLLPGRAAVDLRPGDVLRIETPGGGGFGRRVDIETS